MDILNHGTTGADFRACREYVGWTQQEVANNLEINVTTVKRWERRSTRRSSLGSGWTRS